MVLALADDLAPSEPAIAGPSRRFVGRPDCGTVPCLRHPAAVAPRRPVHSRPVVLVTSVVIGH